MLKSRLGFGLGLLLGWVVDGRVWEGQGIGMKVTNGQQGVLICTANFGETVAFYGDVLGLELGAEGVPVVDGQFGRFDQFGMPKGTVIAVDDLAGACGELAAVCGWGLHFGGSLFKMGVGFRQLFMEVLAIYGQVFCNCKCVTGAGGF